MGKNQAYKAMQRARVGSGSGGPEEMEDGMADGSFHSPEWHAARLASLKTSHTITWEEFKRKQKEDEAKKGELEADKDKMMKEYRAQLDAERASKLAHGRNHSKNKSLYKKVRKEKEEKDHNKKSSKRKKHSRRPSESSSSDSSSSDYSSSDDDNADDREARRSKSRSGSSRRKRKESSRSRSKCRLKRSRSDSEDDDNGPLPLSKFFGNTRS